ncbi:hypothetical protein PENTCL1PPCAC_29187, partial [Pristionchus entomophagus]
NFPSEDYFTREQIIINALILIRILISSIILGCGIKIPKDFLKTITLGIFIPILLGALVSLYIQVATFVSSFQRTPDFHKMFVQWTDGLSSVFTDYIHFNAITLYIIYLHCAKLACSDDESIIVFPTRMVVSLAQAIPLFLCLLPFIPTTSGSFILRAIQVLNKLYLFFAFLSLLVMIVWCIKIVKKDLPYDHARHSDLQVRDARSRLAFLLLYLILPFATLVPFFVDSIIWLVILINGENSKLIIPNQYVQMIIKDYSPIGLSILTIICISPYRRAMLIILRCKKIKVEPLPRKEVELTNMYRYANLEEAME